jgi:hypothetical protein
MAAKLTSLTHKIAITFAVLAPGAQSGNFWIHPRIVCKFIPCDFAYLIGLDVYLPQVNTIVVWRVTANILNNQSLKADKV